MTAGRKPNPDTEKAVRWALAHPDHTLAAVAASFGIHRVTLCRAMRKVRTICTACGQALPHRG